jgi:hypothetical protein
MLVSKLQQISIPVSPTNKTDRHDITEILLEVVLNTITLPSNCPIKKRGQKVL